MQVKQSGSVGAVVVGGDYQGLGIVRSLGRRGVPVCVIDDELSIARFSRYTTHYIRADTLRDETSTINTLFEVLHRLKLTGWVLYPTREETVAAISRHREALSESFRVPTPPWDSVKWAWDKRNTYQIAEELGLAIPRTWYPRDLEDLEKIDANLPLVIKPAIKEHFIYVTKAKAWRADNLEDLRKLFHDARRLVEPGEVMVQEMIPGDGRQQYAFCAFFKEGEPVGSMTVRRRRQHPPEFGRASTFVETVNIPLLEELSLRFLRAIDYYGLVELEYKRDPRDGRYKLLDVNARTWGYHSLGQRAGVDFPYLLFADQIGESVEPCSARAAIRWMRFATDLPTVMRQIVDGSLRWQDYFRSLRGLHTEAVLAADDPVPALIEVPLIPYLALTRGF